MARKLTMKNVRSGVRFELVDEESETTVHLLPEDDQETICRKLRKVLSLASPENAPQTARGKIELDMHSTLKERGREAMARLERDGAISPQPANGWKRYEAPQVPDRLQGEVEIIKEGEE